MRRSLRARRTECRSRAACPPAKPDDRAARAAELALQRLYPVGGRAEMLLEELFENVHGHRISHSRLLLFQNS